MTRVGGDDAGVTLQNGGERWQLLLYGLPVVAAGLWFWNGLGSHFGLGQKQGNVDRIAALQLFFARIVFHIMGELYIRESAASLEYPNEVDEIGEQLELRRVETETRSSKATRTKKERTADQTVRVEEEVAKNFFRKSERS